MCLVMVHLAVLQVRKAQRNVFVGTGCPLEFIQAAKAMQGT